MKIDPTEKQQHIISRNPAQQVDSANPNGEFSKILKDNVRKSSDLNAGSDTGKCHLVQSPMTLNMGIPSMTESADCRTALGLLDALENYQQLLKDPGANLRMVEPAVDKMRSLTENAQPILSRIPEGHPVKTVVQETLVHMSKEIERFNMGYYVDD